MVAAFSYYNHILGWINKGDKLDIWEINSIGGRKSAKTLSSYEFALESCLVADKNTLNVHTFRNIKKDIKEAHKEYVAIIEREGWGHLFEITADRISYNGNNIYFKGLRDRRSEAIVGLGLARDNGRKYSIRIFDEAYEYGEEDIKLIHSGLGGADYTLDIYNANPWLKTNWYIKKCHRAFPENEKVMMTDNEMHTIIDGALYHYTNHLVNDKLKQSDKEQLARVLRDDPLRARVEYYGLAGSIGDGIYSYYIPKIRKYIPSGITDYCIGIDYGEKESATCAMLGATTMLDEVVMVDEYYYANNDNYVKLDMLQFVQQIKNKMINWNNQYKFYAMRSKIPVVVDNAAFGLIALLKKELDALNVYEIRACKKLPEMVRVNKRIEYITRDKYYVSTNCVNHYIELQNQVYDKNKVERKPLDKDNHTTDCGDYILTYFWDTGRLPFNFINN